MNISFRDFREDELELVVTWWSNPKVHAYLPSYSTSIEDQKERFTRIKSDAKGRVVAIVADDTTIGQYSISVTKPEAQICEASLMIGLPHCWGLGIGSLAVRHLTAIAFDELDMHKVMIALDIRNNACRKCFANNGYAYEGCLREHEWNSEFYTDLLLYSVLDSEYENRRPLTREDE